MEIVEKVGRVRSLGRYICLGQDGRDQQVPTPCKSDAFADYKGETFAEPAKNCHFGRDCEESYRSRLRDDATKFVRTAIEKEGYC